MIERVRMELPLVDPFHRRVEQVRRTQSEGHPRALEPVASQQPDGDGPRRQPHRLDGVEKMRACSQPIGRYEEQRDDVDVMAEVVQSPDGDEGVVEMGDQPDALVVDAHIEAVRPIVGLLLVGQRPEHRHVGHHHGHERGDGPGARQLQKGEIARLAPPVSPPASQVLPRLAEGPQRFAFGSGEHSVEAFDKLSGPVRARERGRGCRRLVEEAGGA